MMKNIKIGNKIIGDGEPTFILAEAGINHDGSVKTAKQLIEKAVKVGADAIKFQIYKTEEFCSKKSTYFDMFKSIEFSKKEWIDIFEYAKKKNIICTASVFGEDSTNLLDDLGSPMFKIASGDLTHHPLIRYISKKKKPIILSTGMSDIGEISEALNEIYATGNKNVALLHCVSNYPAKYEDVNLSTIKTMKECFKVPVGFSDHSLGTSIPIASVAIGANIIEKHFTLDKNMKGPDHKLSLDPSEFLKMVNNIRDIEKAIGNGIKKPIKSELEARKIIRRSLVAGETIPKGSIITKDMITIARPGDGLNPNNLDLIIGKKTCKDIHEGETITWDKI